MAVTKSTPTAAVVLLALLSLCDLARAENVYDAIRGRANLTKFLAELEKDRISQIWLQERTATVFAFTDESYERATNHARTSSEIAPYHIAGVSIRREQWPIKTASTKTVLGPLILTTKNVHSQHSASSAGHHHDETEYYVNNARVVDGPWTYRSDDGAEQQLYIIDEVLEPYKSPTGIAPRANDIIQKSASYPDLPDSSLEVFAAQIRKYNLGSLFESDGNHTFFVPLVSSGAKSRLRNLDEVIVRAHVIPNRALYLRAFEEDHEYHSATWDDDNQVSISLPHAGESLLKPGNNNVRVQSRTHRIMGTLNHHVGLVRTAVVTPNIPVRNGVIHFIEKPFMIVDISTWDFIENNKDGQISMFAQLIQRTPSVLSTIRNGGTELTILAPNNHAFEQLGQQRFTQLLENDQEREQLIQLHLVRGESISTDDVRQGKVHERQSLDERRQLYFQVAHPNDHTQVLTVEGGGVNATAVQADIGATNGVIHVLDKVLGIPFQTVYEKLKDDFDLATTYQVGSHRSDYWNRKMAEANKRFTYFAPSKAAWAEMRKTMPSEYKQLVEGLLPVHGEYVLERHLVVSDDDLISYEELQKMDGQTIRAMRGELLVQVENGDVYLNWEGLRAKVTRPDVHAINGVIHVIDHILMKKRDMTTASASGLMPALALSLLTVLRLAL